MKIAYEDWNPNQKSLDLVNDANTIIDEMRRQGYTLTLRQLYYQFVARDWIPNTERSYKNLGNLVTKGRMAGLISWTAIEDRNRGQRGWYSEEDHDKLIEGLEDQISFDFWQRQPHYVEVWVEKEALGNVIARACQKRGVTYLSCKGYLSASEAWRAGRRMMYYQAEGKECHIIHLGDHDPSGIDMTRDNDVRTNLFAEAAGTVHMHRIALNMDQVEDQSPPPNPTKLSDSRAGDYISRYGHDSWELDALQPSYINEIIQSEIEDFIDDDIWAETEAEEAEAKKIFARLAEEWPFLKDEFSE